MRFIFFLLLCNFSITIQGQSWDNFSLRLTNVVDSLMQQHHTIGLSIAVIKDGETIFNKGFGYRDLNKKLPVTAQTVFPIGSVTKPFTSCLIGVHEGAKLLNTSDKPVKHIPYLRFSVDEMNNIVTIADLLSHRSGIGGVDATHVFFPKKNIKQHLQRLPYLKPNSQVRESFNYSNMGYAILGAISSEITGKAWADNIEEYIFKPLEMKNSNCNLTELQASDNYALGYSLSGGKAYKVEYEDQYESFASGAINSSSEDLSKWVAMLLNKGKYKNTQVIPRDYLERAFSEQNIIRGSFNYDRKYNLIADTYGYGWFVHQYRNLYRVNHGGNVSGFTASVDLFPHQNIGIVILTNQTSANLLTSALSNFMMSLLIEDLKFSWKDHHIDVGEAILPLNKYSAIKSDILPSHPLSHMEGTYFSAGYGELKIFLERDKLFVKVPAFTMFLEHSGHNTFVNRVIDIQHQNIPSFYFKFLYNYEGKIDRLAIYFSDKPEIFYKISK